jgi:hypothetical protein
MQLETPLDTVIAYARLARAAGVRVPGIGTCLSLCGLTDLSRIPPAILELARARGYAVHRAIHYLVEGDLDEESIDPSIAGYVAAFRDWAKDLDLSTALAEVPAVYDCGRHT